MILEYEFSDGAITPYQVSWRELMKAMSEIFADTYQIDKDKAETIVDDLCLYENENIREYFREDIEDYFYAEAKEHYKECEAQSKEENRMQYWERI